MNGTKVGVTPVTLWSDRSRAAQSLRSELEAQGYHVVSIFSGSTRPVAAFGDTYVSGFGEIRTLFSSSNSSPNHHVPA